MAFGNPILELQRPDLPGISALSVTLLNLGFAKVCRRNEIGLCAVPVEGTEPVWGGDPAEPGQWRGQSQSGGGGAGMAPGPILLPPGGRDPLPVPAAPQELFHCLFLTIPWQ